MQALPAAAGTACFFVSAEEKQHEEGNDLAGVAGASAMREKQDEPEEKKLLVADSRRKERVRLALMLLARFFAGLAGTLPDFFFAFALFLLRRRGKGKEPALRRRGLFCGLKAFAFLRFGRRYLNALRRIKGISDVILRYPRRSPLPV